MCEQDRVKMRQFKSTDLAEVKSLIHRTIDTCYRGIYCDEAVKFFKEWHCDQKITENAKEGYTIVLDQNSKVIGTGTIVNDEIVGVFVDPAFQKRGFGKLIMREIEEKAISLGIGAVKLDASLSSKQFYDSLGYVTLEETFLVVENNERLDYYKMEKVFVEQKSHL